MKLYNGNGIWFDEQADGRLFIGITAEADKAMAGIAYVEFSDGHLAVESVKTVHEEDLPVKGESYDVSEAFQPGHWDEDRPLIIYGPGYELDKAFLTEKEPCLA